METTSVSTPSYSRSATDRQVKRLQELLRRWPARQEAYVQLGGAYLAKARETGDTSQYAQAEQALLKALELEPASAEAMALMGAVNLGWHQFQQALTWAERSLKIDAANAGAYGVLGDAQVELGQYEAALQSFQRMVDLKPNLDSYARVSYARELMGDVDGAIEAMQMAIKAGHPAAENTAWAYVQLGNLYFNSGRLDEASRHYEAALQLWDDYHLALAALARARAAQGHYDDAISLYQRAVAIIPQPATLAALGDLYSLTGSPDRAQLQYDTVEFIAQLQSQAMYNRELALFYTDHHLKPELALALAENELEVRKDIYGYDALAWALYRNGRLEEAAQAMSEAMKLGTQDPNLFYHAGMIHYSLGSYEKALAYLQQALDLNPRFSVLHADVAKATLDETQRILASRQRAGASP